MQQAVLLDPYERWYQAQEGACGICGRKQVLLRLDYCGGKPRGLLCAPCRLALSSLQNDRQRAKQIQAYLQRHAEQTRSQSA